MILLTTPYNMEYLYSNKLLKTLNNVHRLHKHSHDAKDIFKKWSDVQKDKISFTEIFHLLIS